MSVLMYAPGFKIYISTAKNGILDISDDVTQGSLVRRSSGVSSLSFTLQNARRKYDGIFIPNDRVIVMMKRITWVRVFTGYLNAVPLVTAWPMAVQMTASCTLKRLQYYYWDPGLAASQQLVANAINATQHPDDGGTANAIITLLSQVASWPAQNTHIAGIPQPALRWTYSIAKSVQASLAEADKLAQQFYSYLGANGTVGGVLQGGVAAAGSLKAGSYGGVSLSQAQADTALAIYNVGASMGASNSDRVVAIAVAMQESSLGTGSMTGNLDSVGVFQQRPSQGWGTAAQLSDVNYAAKKFYEALAKITGRGSMTVGQQGQAVQHSADASGQTYQKWAPMATQVVGTLGGGNNNPNPAGQDPGNVVKNAGSSSGSSSGGGSGGGGALGPQNQGAGLAGVATVPAATGSNATKAAKTSGPALLQTALNLVQQHPNIPYQEGGDSAYNSAVPTLLDCSSFVQWVAYHTFGKIGGCPRVAADQQAWCKSGGSIVSADQGMKTQGALMFIGTPASHVEISLGDGQHTVGAHHSGTFAGVVSSSGAWTNAGLMPNIDYSAAGGAGATAGGTTINLNPLNAGVQLSTGSAQPWYNPANPFDVLFSNSPYAAIDNSADMFIAEAMTGPRALLPDSPLLPYIKNLVDATMRSFCSAPNGDFMAWFPDYYGLWGTAAIMQIEPIELRDFSVWWDDTNLVTHQFVTTPISQNMIDLGTGMVSNVGPLSALITTGIASIDVPAIMQGLFGLESTPAEAKKFIDFVYQRFGARPDYQQMVGLVGPAGEFFAALYLFMQSWAYQYNADVPITFMPELWPGMLIKIPAFGFQAYVTTVTHTWQMGPGGGYTTTVNIAAPARLPGNEGNSQFALIGMPLAAGMTGLASPPTLKNTQPIPTPHMGTKPGQALGPQNQGAGLAGVATVPVPKATPTPTTSIGPQNKGAAPGGA